MTYKPYDTYMQNYPGSAALPRVCHKRNGTTVTMYADRLRIVIRHSDWRFVHRYVCKISGTTPIWSNDNDI